MRVTIINQFYTPDVSPTAHLSASLAEHLAARGHDVTVVASKGGYVPASKADAKAQVEGNPSVRRIWTPQFGKATILKRCADYATFYLGALFTLLTLPKQDVVVSLTTPPYIAWAGVLHTWIHPGSKVALWNMDCYPDAAERLGVLKQGGVASRLMRWLNRRLFRRLDHLICLDTAMVDLLMSQYGPKPERGERPLPVDVIPNWEKASFFPKGAEHAEWDRAEALGLRDRFTVLYLGNTGFGHEFDTALDAAAALKDEPVTFLFVGGGSRWKEIEAGAKRRGLSNVAMHGYVAKEQTPGLMAGADCALITLRDEALGVMSPSKLHSNLAMGLPVVYVGPEKSNVDDAIARFGCGVSARIGEVDRVVAAVRAMLHEPIEHAALRDRARDAFDEAYCDERTLPKFERVLAEIVGEKPRAATEGALS
ncbi:MAG: glycosyltransferase family 4 protein [Phycisphaerales bacterium]